MKIAAYTDRAQERSGGPWFRPATSDKVFNFERADFEFDLGVDFLNVDGGVGVLQDGREKQITTRLILTIDLEDGLG